MRFKFGTAVPCLLLLYAITSFPATESLGVVKDTLEIFKLIEMVTENVLKAWDLIDELPFGDNGLPIMKSKQNQIMDRLDQLSTQITNVEKNQMEYFKENIDILVQRQLTDTVKSHKIFIVNDIFKIIGTRYNLLSPFQRENETSEPYTLIAYAEWCVKPSSSSLISLLEQLHYELFGVPEIAVDESDNRTLFAELVSSFDNDTNQICSSGRSPQQFAYELYTKAALAEVKAYVMMEFSWMTLRHFAKGNFTHERMQMRDSYEGSMVHSQQLLHEVLQHTGRVYWRCDPKPGEHVLGKTYDVITRLILGFVDNEINLNPDGTCYQTCEDYTNTRTEGCYESELCSKQPKCTGRVHNCRFIDTDLQVCQSNTANSTRRYHYVKGGDGRFLGTNVDKLNKSCDSLQDVADSWSSKLFWRCNYCFCLCDEDDLPSDRYFNLRDTLSDFSQNMIVTGTRFIKDQGVIHLQLQQGELLPGGRVNQSTLAWIPLESFDITHVDIRSGYDYHKLSYKSRSVDLDEITAHNDSLVVTGARFRVVDKHLNLEVRFSTFNFTTGRLLLPHVNSVWLANNNEKRKKLTLKDPQQPDKTKLYSTPLSGDNQFIDFVSSSIDMDAAQSTVPYIDVQDVTLNPAVPLSGLGIYHKGRSGFGGFIAPKVVTLDLTHTLVPPKVKTKLLY